ncbi:hypothetical protein FOZ63_019459, partial [Perkinsus olseni]
DYLTSLEVSYVAFFLMSISSESSKVSVAETGQSNFSAVVNIILTGIGVGMLGLPGAIAQAGYVLGFILLLACGAEGLLDTHLLRKCMSSNTRNYEDIGRDAFGVPAYAATGAKFCASGSGNQPDVLDSHMDGSYAA